jgi:hypothetical protein
MDFVKEWLKSAGVIPAIVGLVASILSWLFARFVPGLPQDIIPLIVSLVEAALVVWAGASAVKVYRARLW